MDKIAGIPGVWLDVDFDCPDIPSNKKRLSQGKANELIAKLTQPSIVLHSGHGFQAWWLFKELWMFDTSEEWDAAQRLVRRFNVYAQSIAQSMGGTIDSTHDLARVMRIPGTWNNKSKPVKVKIVTENEIRYNPDDLEEFVQGVQLLERSVETVKSTAHGFTLNLDADPPYDLHQALLTNNPKAKQTWYRKRKDLGDQSGSGYDMSWACFCIDVEWTDQQIVDSICACKRLHSDNPRTRPEYYATIIAKARSFRSTTEASEKLDELEMMDDPDPVDQLAAVSARLGIKITKIIKYRADPEPSYEIHTERGKIQIKSAEILQSQMRFAAKMLALANKVIPKLQSAEWRGVLQALVDACEEENLSMATDEEVAQAWLDEYFNDKRARILTDDFRKIDALRSSSPFEDNTHYHFWSDPFFTWLKINKAERYTKPQVGIKLKSIGCFPKAISVKDEAGKNHCKAAWRVEKDFRTNKGE